MPDALNDYLALAKRAAASGSASRHPSSIPLAELRISIDSCCAVAGSDKVQQALEEAVVQVADLQELNEVIAEFSSNYDKHFDKLMLRIPPSSYAGMPTRRSGRSGRAWAGRTFATPTRRSRAVTVTSGAWTTRLPARSCSG